MVLGNRDQNFAKQVPVEKTRRPAGFYKQIAFDAATIIAALWFSFAYSQFLDGTTPLPILIVIAIIFSILSSIQAFLPQTLKRRTSIIVIEIIALLAFFPTSPYLSYLIPLLFVFFLWGEISARQELKNSLRIRFFKTSLKQLSKVLTGITLLAVIIYLPQLDASKISVPESGFNTFFKIFTSITHKIYPEINLELTVGEVARDIAELKLKGNLDYLKLDFNSKENSIQTGANEIIKQLSEGLSSNIKSDQPASDLLYTLTTSTLEDWRNRLGDVFIIGWIIILFFLVKSLMVLIGWFSALIAYFIFQSLQSTNFIHAIGENSMQEVIEY